MTFAYNYNDVWRKFAKENFANLVKSRTLNLAKFSRYTVKQQLIAVSSHKNLEKGTVQPTIHSTAEPPSLAEVEVSSYLAACIPHILSPHPAPGRLLVGEVEELKVCEWGGPFRLVLLAGKISVCSG